MYYKIGDSLRFDTGREYMVINYCTMNNKEYYLMLDKGNIMDMIITEKKDDTDNLTIIKDKNEISQIINAIIEQGKRD